MKRLLAILLALIMACAPALADTGATGSDVIKYADLLSDLLKAYREPSEEALALIDADAAILDEPLAYSIAEQWKATWLDPDYKLYTYGEDDPSTLAIAGEHAIVVLGLALVDGEMPEELKGRCDAAAALAEAFPDSIIICSGGATGLNNPDNHTEAGLMQAYLTETQGIAPERILIDENAYSTAGNALNSLAMLEELGIDSMTLVTSKYHMLRGLSLFNAVVAYYMQERDYSVELTGNYCYDTGANEDDAKFAYIITLAQLGELLILFSP